ncbi:MAG: hypothetical protein J7647_08255 [Cyanobacteria bacterium SBLK]|nr:hypothetical protein [Cyanobacteria bacterium SBLK]
MILPNRRMGIGGETLIQRLNTALSFCLERTLEYFPLLPGWIWRGNLAIPQALVRAICKTISLVAVQSGHLDKNSRKGLITHNYRPSHKTQQRSVL